MTSAGGAPEEPPAAKAPEARREMAEDEAALVTKGFLTSLFESLCSDLQELRKDISHEVKELRVELTSLGERITQVEDGEAACGEEVSVLQQQQGAAGSPSDDGGGPGESLTQA
ncbi:hypothetical protein NDU88_004880 [Pleurodeles waltl]|uniref:Uncharacterized protein n=1 Tax=Pleurodeles waltl TaxID=8319 RepID=A0AAV7QGS2_PLEWA|nr:hypothetical protein NDU88_004880 [Pleurodeles waltl]